MWLQAPPGYSAAPTLPGKGDNECIEAQLPLFLFSNGVWDKYDAMRPFLEVALIHLEHDSHSVLHKAEDLLLRKMVWLSKGAAGITELRRKADRPKLQKVAEKRVESVMQMKIMKERRAMLFHGGYSFLCRFVDLMILPGTAPKPAGRGEGNHGIEMRALWDFGSLTIPVAWL